MHRVSFYPALVTLSLLIAAPAAAQSTPPIPAFRVQLADGTYREYAGATAYDDGQVRAKLTHLGNGRWRLNLRNLGPQLIREVWYPWIGDRPALGGNESDDLLYYPNLFGVAKRAVIPMLLGEDQDELAEWYGSNYPGSAAAPLMVLADRTQGILLAAANWPPQKVSPRFAQDQLGILYFLFMFPNQVRDFDGFYVVADGNTNAGRIPWQLALDPYKAWLKQRMAAAGLTPDYPEAMRRANGWIQVALSTFAEFDPDVLRNLWNRWGDRLPWMQCWGQMSNYSGPPFGEPDLHNAVPPLEPGEETGCCMDVIEPHERYIPGLFEVGQEIIEDDGLFGLYSRPPDPYAPLTTPNSPSLEFLENWTDSHALLGANAFFVDAVGGYDFGDPLAIAHLLRDNFPAMTVIEHTTDMYGAAHLIGGSLWGGWNWHTDPHDAATMIDSPQFQKGTAPAFMRYLLDDRIIFLGCANGDHSFWGQATGKGYYSERQVFLLGAKYDVSYYLIAESANQQNTMNIVMSRAISEWQRVNFWEREPQYVHRAGIFHVPPGVDVRRFVDRDGINLFAIDNPNGVVGQTFTFMNHQLAVPAEPLSIVEYGSGCPTDFDGDGVTAFADLGQLLQNYGQNSGGDTDGDADTDLADLGLLLQNYNVICN